MAKASSITTPNNISFLFKSSPGFGKTLAAASFAVEGPVYLAYWDKSSPVELTTFFTEKRFGSLAKKILDNIEFDIYGSDNANAYLNKLIDLSNDCRYFAIINDSITFMTAGAVNWSMNFGKDPKLKKKIKDVLPDWDEYKVETSIVSQCIDLCKKLPCHSIWTAHPLAGVSLSGSGNSMRVTRTNSIVSYGQKVASMVPGSFTEIYHFSQQSDYSSEGKNSKRFIVNTEAVGDEFAKSPLLGDYVKEFDITGQLFYTVWSKLIKESRGETTESKEPSQPTIHNPFQPETSEWKV
jgi:hypothetical protein